MKFRSSNMMSGMSVSISSETSACRVSASEVEESIALLGKAHLFNKAAHAGGFSAIRGGNAYRGGRLPV